MDMSGMDHQHGGGDMAGKVHMGYTHMTFFWGKDSEILFSGWPGTRGGMYALALMVVFVLAALLELLSGFVPGRNGGGAAAGLAQTAAHAVRVALAYVVMLAVMSFNVGVLIVAVAGHTLGFLLFRSSMFRRHPESTSKTGDSNSAMAC